MAERRWVVPVVVGIAGIAGAVAGGWFVWKAIKDRAVTVREQDLSIEPRATFVGSFESPIDGTLFLDVDEGTQPLGIWLESAPRDLTMMVRRSQRVDVPAGAVGTRSSPCGKKLRCGFWIVNDSDRTATARLRLRVRVDE